MDVPLMSEPFFIQTCRKVVSERQCCSINNDTGLIRAEIPADLVEMAEEAEMTGAVMAPCTAIILDLFTASMVVQVYDALNEENKSKFPALINKYGCAELIVRLWKIIK